MSLKTAIDSGHGIFDGISQILEGADPTAIRPVYDRVLIRDLGPAEKPPVGIEIPQAARDKAQIRLGVVVATGNGDRFQDLGLDGYGNVRYRAIQKPCPECETGRFFDARAFEWVTCPACHGTQKIPVTVPCECKPGDRVLYDRRKEAEFIIGGVRHVICHEEQAVLMVLE